MCKRAGFYNSAAASKQGDRDDIAATAREPISAELRKRANLFIN